MNLLEILALAFFGAIIAHIILWIIEIKRKVKK